MYRCYSKAGHHAVMGSLAEAAFGLSLFLQEISVSSLIHLVRLHWSHFLYTFYQGEYTFGCYISEKPYNPIAYILMAYRTTGDHVCGMLLLSHLKHHF